MAESLHPEELITSVIFVRHGHTQQTEQGKLYCDMNATLSERGEKQAAEAAKWLKKESPALLLSSAAVRVKSTAEIIGSELGITTEVIPDLNEQNVGEWEGRTYLEIKKEHPDMYKQWCADPVRNAAPGGESIEELASRVDRDLQKMIETHQGKKIFLITHAGVIRSAIVKALGMPIENFWRVSIPTGSISRIDYSNNFATMHYMALRVGE